MRNRIKLIVISIFLLAVFFCVGYNFDECHFRDGFYENFWGSIFAGLILTVILFSLDEFIYRVDLSGEWQVTESISRTTWNPYLGFEVHFIYHLLQKGNEITGYGEKVWQKEKGETITIFEAGKRVRVEIEGYIKKSYLRSTEINLLIYEYGRKRESSTTYAIKIVSFKKLLGIYRSTAANAQGPVKLERVEE